MSQSPFSNGTVTFPSPLDIGGLALAVLPFICSFGSSSTTTVNGQVVEESSIDLFDILGGGGAVLLGLYIAATLLSQTSEADRPKRIALIVGVILLGVYHVATGLDLIEGFF
jgi:hypothetical protein